MDVSRELWSLVETKRQQHHNASASSSSKNNAVLQQLSTSLEEQQANASLLRTSQALNDAVANAIARASAHVRAVVVALDAATPSSTSHLQNSLLLSDAELLSVSSSLKAFTETLTKVSAVTTAKRKGKATAVSKAAETQSSEWQGSDSVMGSVGRGTGIAAHLQLTVHVQEQRVSAKRLQVALAKEELALYKSELFLYGHCGVLSCSDAVAAQLAQCRPAPTTTAAAGLSNEKNLSAIAETDPLRGGRPRSGASSPMATPKPSRSGFGTTFRVVDGMMQRAAQTMKAAGSHADSALHVALTGSHAAARQLLNAGTSSVDGIWMAGTGGDRRRGGNAHSSTASKPAAGRGGVRAIPLPPPSHDELTKEEEARLQEQSHTLLQMQQEATAQDAKAVEASIRELSQLTSLMNEQVVQQTEQFSVVVRNTEAAHNNVQKAVGEVKKPLQAFWNPTRQLIALLWMCMALVLMANRFLR